MVTLSWLLCSGLLLLSFVYKRQLLPCTPEQDNIQELCNISSYYIVTKWYESQCVAGIRDDERNSTNNDTSKQENVNVV